MLDEQTHHVTEGGPLWSLGARCESHDHDGALKWSEQGVTRQAEAELVVGAELTDGVLPALGLGRAAGLKDGGVELARMESDAREPECFGGDGGDGPPVLETIRAAVDQAREAGGVLDLEARDLEGQGLEIIFFGAADEGRILPELGESTHARVEVIAALSCEGNLRIDPVRHGMRFMAWPEGRCKRRWSLFPCVRERVGPWSRICMNEPLYRLFPSSGPGEDEPTRPVGWRGGKWLSQGELGARVRLVQRRLEALSSDPEVLLFCRGRLDFLVGLLAIWRAGRVAYLASSVEGLRQMRSSGLCAVVSRAEDALGMGSSLCLDELSLSELESEGSLSMSFSEHQPILRLVTSGTSGHPEVHEKTAGQVLGEVCALRERLGWTSDDVVLASVPPHHLYGLLFSILLPLSVGAPIVLDARAEPDVFHPLVWAELVQGARATRLVTVPVHLRTLLEAQLGSLAPARQLIGSAAALDPEWARGAHELWGLDVVDVLGSTETGGIALRRPVTERAWRPLPRVRLRVDEELRLWVRSPFADGEAREVLSGDRGVLQADGSFLHQGRSDGIVKIGGRRISLQEIEACVKEKSGVREARALARDVSGLRGQEIWLVVEGSELSEAQLFAHLRERLEPVFVPRRLRVVSALPINDRGKVTRDALLALFPSKRPSALLGCSEGRWLSPEEWECELVIPADSPRFSGHFPERPVLPAVAQLTDWVLPCARAHFGAGELRKVSRLKFLRPLLPGAQLKLRLKRAASSGAVSFQILEDGIVAASGNVSFAPSEGPLG